MEYYRTLKECDPAGEYLTAQAVDGPKAGEQAIYERKDGQICLIYGTDLLGITEADECWQDGLREKDGSRIYAERLCAGVKIVICGAGHVSMPVIRLAKMLSYDVTVIDDRAEFAERAYEAGADRVISEEIVEALKKIRRDNSTAFVLVTRGHKSDLGCLREILGDKFAYLGMMGSRKRTALIRETLAGEGFPVEEIAKIRMPIGIPIHSQTPEEIAVSILAEVISELNGSGAESRSVSFPKGMLEEICEYGSADGRSGHAVLAMIVAKRGEGPREPGTKMLVKEDGSFTGTIGGGYAEAKILEEARKMLRELQENKPVRRESMRNKLIGVNMFPDQKNESTMMCGGEIEVFLEMI